MAEVKRLVTKTEFNRLPAREVERRMCKWSMGLEPDLLSELRSFGYAFQMQ
jgi:hypothetical protein